ncbi:MAG: hypothetical protein JXD23_11360 [Spirochaetales bacterium]|nr:hypothetical protein [Spirochaetales bacterium]
MKRRFAISYLLALILMPPACSDNAPQINSVQWQVVFFRNRLMDVTYQRLSVFVLANDKDGEKDLATINVINDDDELFWSIPSEKWEKASVRGVAWIGSNGLAMPDGRNLPTGMYRVLVEDQGGKTAETQFYMKKENVETANARFPSVSVKNDRILVEGDFTDPELWIFDANDVFIDRLPMPQKFADISSIRTKYKQLAAGFTYYAYAKKSGIYFGVMIGPYYYSP